MVPAEASIIVLIPLVAAGVVAWVVRRRRRTTAPEEIPVPATPPDVEALASDVESVWNDPETDIRIKKRIARTLIEEIIADVL